jgi:hypothetical protein
MSIATTIDDAQGVVQSATTGTGTLSISEDTTIKANLTLSGTYLTMAGVTQTGGRKQIISTGVVLTSAQSGAILIADGGSAQTFTLPAPAQGLHFKMYAGAAYAHKIQVPAGAAKIYGNAINTNNEQAEKAEGQKVTAAISVAFGVALQGGDFMEVVCNGSHWFLHAVTNDPLTIVT